MLKKALRVEKNQMIHLDSFNLIVYQRTNQNLRILPEVHQLSKSLVQSKWLSFSIYISK